MWGFLFMERRRKVRCGVEGLIEGVLVEQTFHQNTAPSIPSACWPSRIALLHSLHLLLPFPPFLPPLSPPPLSSSLSPLLPSTLLPATSGLAPRSQIRHSSMTTTSCSRYRGPIHCVQSIIKEEVNDLLYKGH